MATLLPAEWGWAFISVTPPWVAHLVWPIPTVPDSGDAASRADSIFNFPTARLTCKSPLSMVAIPEES